MGFRDKLKSGLRSSKPDSSTPSRNPSPAPPAKIAPVPAPAAPTPAAPPAAASKAPSETKVVSQPKEPAKQDAPAEENLPVPSLQEKIWNQAYDNLKESNAKLTDAYEKILSAELQGQEPTGSATIKNEISDNREARNKQMQAMVSKGLERTKRHTSIKEGLGQGLQVVDSVRGIVDQSIQAAPQAAVAWVGVCMGLEVCNARSWSLWRSQTSACSTN